MYKTNPYLYIEQLIKHILKLSHMATTVTTEKYNDAIDSLIVYAESINFKPGIDCFDTLMKNWIEHSRKLHADICDNKELVIKMIKNIF